MRRLVMEDLNNDAPVVVLQEGSDELWLINSRYANDLPTVATACNDLLEKMDAPRMLPWHLRLLRRAIRPLCQLVHTCDGL